jgi:DNA-binding winged helix-turn-helix (wHTH) protein/tetratricopeptide (TPR) repeat protein
MDRALSLAGRTINYAGSPENPVSEDCETARTVYVGQHRVDLETWEVSANEEHTRLAEKPFRVLEALLERQGQVVTRVELQQRLWPDGTIVDFDNNLNSAVATLRTTFGDSARAPKIIETLPRLGYRLVGEVCYDEPDQALAAPAHPSHVLEPSANGTEGRRRPLLVAAAAGFAIALFVTAGTLFSASRSSAEIEVPGNASARAPWQRGLYLQAQDSAADQARAAEAYRETLKLAPDFAPAHTKLAETLAEMSFKGGLDLREGLAQARISATRALSLDGSSASALRVRSLANLHLDWDFPAAGRDLESALRLDPQDAEIYLAAATFLMALGANDAAVVAAQRAVDLDPASSLLKADLGYFLVAAGRYTEAIDACDDLLRVEPDSVLALKFRSIAAERLGRSRGSITDALKIMELRGVDPAELERLWQGDSESASIAYRRWELAEEQSNEHPSLFQVAVRHAWLNQRAEALSLLERCLEQREPWLLYLGGYSQFDSLRQDPRLARIVESVRGQSLEQDDVTELVAAVEKLL